MGYYIRILGKNTANIPLQQLRLDASPAVIEVDSESGDAWESLVLRHDSGAEIAAIEKNLVTEGSLGAEELSEFLEEVSSLRPQSAAVWLQGYLRSVKVIYAFQLLSGTEANDGWARLHKVYGAAWRFAGGILQADGEGFTDEDGFTVVWQFSDSAAGAWNVGVLGDEGRWVHFEIDLGDQRHRRSFWSGQVPTGAKLL